MLKYRTQYRSAVHITQCLLLFFALMPTTEAVAQSEITHRVTTGDAGYRGRVRSVQIMQSCNSQTERCSRVQEEMFNAEGLRTSIVTIDSLGRFYTKCHYDANGRMRYVIEGFPAGADSIVFHYDRKGCMMASSVTRFTHKGIDKDMSNVFRIECDDHCRRCCIFRLGETPPNTDTTRWGDWYTEHCLEPRRPTIMMPMDTLCGNGREAPNMWTSISDTTSAATWWRLGTQTGRREMR